MKRKLYRSKCVAQSVTSLTHSAPRASFINVLLAFLRNSIQHLLSLQVRPENFHYLTRIHYSDRGDGVWGEHEIDYILFLQKDVDVRPNPAEVSAVKWIKRANLEQEIASLDEPLTPWFELILKSGRLDMWWQSLRNLKKHEDYETIHKLN